MSVNLDPRMVEELARAATGRAGARVDRWELTPAAHRVENMTTHSLERLTGRLVDGTHWSVFAKTLHPASDSPWWHAVPEEHHAAVLEDLNWLDEPRVYRCGLRQHMPAGLRLPEVYRIDQTASQVTIWMQDVADHGSWDLERYHRAASALGRLGARWGEAEATARLGMGRRPLDSLFYGKITHVDVPRLAADDFWRDPAVAAAVDDRHRDDLDQLVHLAPVLLDRLNALPHGMAHGDATPDNLREPGDGTIVAIDWSYGACAPLGSDLGQLLAGRVESGAADGDQLPDIASTIVDGYCAGLAAEGGHGCGAHVEEAFATHLAIRSVFSALNLDHRPDLGEHDRWALLRRRAALGRFGLDLAARILSRS